MEKTYPIFEKILEELPKDANISSTCFEGANIILYTKNKEFFLKSSELMKSIVDKIKKRVELRPDSSLLEDVDKTDTFIRSKIPPEANLFDIWFDTKRSIVVIEAGKPGLAIGKGGELIKEIREKTFWVPFVRRAPAAKSKLIRAIRHTLFTNSEYRKKFMNKIGQKIYSDWKRSPKYWVRLSCLGGCREVGRSCFLLQTPTSKVLIDCGVNVAASDDFAYPYFEAPEFRIDELDAVIISHSHLDHMGALPILFKYGYTGPVYCTEATRDIMTLLQLDYIDVSFMDAKKPLYSSKEIKECVKHTICLDYGEVTDITPDVRLTLFNSGHILGSSLVHLNIGNGFHNLLYTGDFKYAKSRLLDQATSQFQRVETLMMESTYGSSQDILPSRAACENELLNIIKETTARGGKVLIPVLGVGRAQEILTILESALRNNELGNIPVFVDGMVWDITAIHTAYPELLNKDIRELIFKKDINPFLTERFSKVGSFLERKKIIEETGPCVILATSGMLTGGPSVYYLQELAENKDNAIVFVSYQGEGSLGRKIVSGEKEVSMMMNNSKAQSLKINLDVHMIPGFTGHAGRNELMDYVRDIRPRPRRVIINHGEASKCIDLASSLHKAFKVETLAPKELEAIRLR